MKSRIILVIIILVGFILRIYLLGTRPAGFTWDEAALGYNAYSLLQTGRDEYGQLAPVVFKSFGDYKPGLYIYFTVPAVKLFGLSEFATRLPSAIFGTLLLLALFVLSKLLFPKILNIEYWTLIVACVNPWLLQFSRGAWEANLNLLLTTLGVTLLLRGSKKQSTIYYLLSTIFFGLTFWTYQSAKLFTPLLLLSIIIIYKRVLSIKKLVPSLLLLLLLLLPVVKNLASQSGRLKVFSVFSYTRSSGYVREILHQDGTPTPNLIYFLFHSELLDHTRGVLQRYLNHLSPRFLFSEGDWTSLRHSVYKHGYFYLVEVVPLALGFFILLSRLRTPNSKLLGIWLLLSPLPAALSRDLVSGVRSLPLAIPWVIIIALGLSRLSKNKFIFPVYSVLAVIFLIYYLDFYYFHQSYYSASEWVYPYKPAYRQVAAHLATYSKVYFTDKLGQPYIFALFYLKYDPVSYQRQARLTQNQNSDVGRVDGFDKFIFGPVFWPQLRGQTNSLIIGDQYELPTADLEIPGLVRLADITYPNGQPGLKIVAIP